MVTPLEMAEKLAGAVSELYGATHRAALITLADGHASATDTRLTVRVPFDFGVSGVVSGVNMLKGLRTLGADAVLVDTEDAVLIKKARRQLTLNKLAETITYDLPHGEPKPLPAGFARACKLVAPFMSLDKSRPAFTGARVMGDFIYATNNIVVSRTPFEIDDDFSMPDHLVAYIAGREDPSAYCATSHTVAFWYDDGSVVIGLRLAEQMPDRVVDIFDRWREPDFVVTDEWKQDVLYAFGSGSDVLTLSPDNVSSNTDVSKTSAHIITPIENPIAVTKKFAQPVFDTATALAFDPNVISWSGNGIAGLMALRV